MTQYIGNPDYSHGQPPRTGVLLVNLGTPDDPGPAAVRRYLREFLSDPRVIEAPRALWWLILNGVILRTRPKKSAHAYRKIWTPQGSPLLIASQELTAALGARLGAASSGRVLTGLAMTYGQPSIPAVLEEFRRNNVHRLLVLPLYPQYSSTTTGTIFARVTAELSRWRWMPELRFVNQYWEQESYLAAVAGSVAEHWRHNGRKHLLFSFHSIPKRYFTAGDPYHCFCRGTARAVAERLGLTPDEWSVSFQSRFGREEWLKPYTDHQLLEFAKSGPKRVTVVCPGFATDCLETLEEINMQNRELFLAAGGEEFDYVPCLNASGAHVDALEATIRDHARGWREFEDEYDPARQAALRSRAIAMGARD